MEELLNQHTRMTKEIELNIFPHNLGDYKLYKNLSAKKLSINVNEIRAVRVIRRSIDARRKNPTYKIRAIVYINEQPTENSGVVNFQHAKSDKKVLIVGSGPAGLFAALRLLERGIKPIILERGKDIRERRRDLRSIQQDGIVNPDSNYCFGEGGAGTYSDGKLYTRSTKRGDVKRILNLLVQHGAQNEILIDAHPHIGSNVLPKVIEKIRSTILIHGGELHFNSRVTDLIIKDSKILGVVVNDKEFFGDSVILATGHSAKDIYYLMDKNKLKLESKSFAMGVRIEHPQKLIDSIQYHSDLRPENLPAASYNLTCKVDDKGVYSFCMCPGGIIIPASTDSDELVLNGMSISRRDSAFANSGLVVTVDDNDWKEYKTHGTFAGLEYQRELERIAYKYGGGKQKAPAQRITDFTRKRVSANLPKSSYTPGVNSQPLHEILPKSISSRLQRSLRHFDKKMKGYYTEEAQILAAETRTSSPIRIPRDKETLMHVQVEGLFPSGEGAGYAGGIVSAAIDGERCADAAMKYLHVD